MMHDTQTVYKRPVDDEEFKDALRKCHDECAEGDDYPKHVWTPETGWVHEDAD